MIRKKAFVIFAAAFLLGAGANAGVVIDGSMGTAGPLEGPAYDIRAEYGQQAGGNLFHSFRTFDLETEEKAVFSGPESVRNIISRITGGQSTVNGAIVSEIAGADMYFLNPAGIIFGQNASLDIQGSFHAGTADYLRLGQNDRFYSVPVSGEVLSFETPSAYGFLYDTSSPIEFEAGAEADAGLTVPEGETFSLVGGDISVSGFDITASEGKIVLAATASEGEAVIDESGVDVSNFERLGTISISDGASASTGGEASGTIVVRGSAFYLKDSVLVSDTGNEDGGIMDIGADVIDLDNGDIYSDTLGTGSCGNIQLSGSDGGPADSVELKNAARIFSNTERTDENTGNAGSISIASAALAMSGRSQISSSSLGPGNGGQIDLNIAESTNISDSKIFASSEGTMENAGDAGTITISTGSFTLFDSGGDESIVSSDTWGGGAGGKIHVNAQSFTADGGSVYSGAAGPAGTGNAGEVVIRSENIAFVNGGKIGSESFNRGKGGTVILDAPGTMEISGADADGNESMIYTSALGEDEGTGDAGNIDIEAGTVIFRDGGGVSADTQGPGQAGIVTVNANQIVLDNKGSISTATTAGGGAGDVTITTGGIGLYAGSYISSASSSLSDPAGDAGTITIDADSFIMRDSSITTQAENAGKGKVFVTAGNMHSMVNSSVTTSIKRGGNDAGDINVQPPEWVTMNNSFIVANAWEGRGGNIHIEADHFIQSIGSMVDASSALGIDGSVEIESPDVDAGSGLIVLPAAMLDATKWMETPCALRSGEAASRFVISGRDALPATPYDITTPRLLWFDEESK